MECLQSYPHFLQFMALTLDQTKDFYCLWVWSLQRCAHFHVAVHSLRLFLAAHGYTFQFPRPKGVSVASQSSLLQHVEDNHHFFQFKSCIVPLRTGIIPKPITAFKLPPLLSCPAADLNIINAISLLQLLPMEKISFSSIDFSFDMFLLHTDHFIHSKYFMFLKGIWENDVNFTSRSSIPSTRNNKKYIGSVTV